MFSAEGGSVLETLFERFFGVDGAVISLILLS